MGASTLWFFVLQAIEALRGLRGRSNARSTHEEPIFRRDGDRQRLRVNVVSATLKKRDARDIDREGSIEPATELDT